MKSITYSSFTGKVVEGNRIGRKLGFPTANLLSDEPLPPKGVYVAHIEYEDKSFYGLLNIGTRPTLHLKEISVEVYIFEFFDIIYHQTLCITPLNFLSDEGMFNSLQQLQKQLEIDKINALRWLNENQYTTP